MFKIFNYFIINPINKLIKIIKYNFLNLNKFYFKRNFKIFIPYNSDLDQYVKIHRFNKFIHFLSKNLSKNSVVIDIGANIGDTTIEILLSNRNLSVKSIEGSLFYYKYLDKNLINFRKKFNNKLKIKSYLNYIGNNIKGSIDIDKQGSGSYSKVGNSKFLTLDNFIKSVGILDSNENISLIKIDTDGYDYDIINSGFNIIKLHKPIIFFEAYCVDKNKLFNYNKTLNNLNKLGYVEWAVFDNCGSLILKNISTKLVKELLIYTYRQYIGKQYGVPYFDIAAYSSKYKNLVKKTLTQYSKFSENKILQTKN
jgi:FkbM family methyltransferase